MNLFKLKYLFVYSLKFPFNPFKLNNQFSANFTSNILNSLNLNEKDKFIGDKLISGGEDSYGISDNFIFNTENEYKYLLRGSFFIKDQEYDIHIHRKNIIPFFYNFQKKFLNNIFYKTFFLKDTIYISINKKPLVLLNTVCISSFLDKFKNPDIFSSMSTPEYEAFKKEEEDTRTTFVENFKSFISN